MKNWKMIINILAFLGLVACQGNKEAISDKQIRTGNEAGLPVPPSENYGGIDGGGGGNGVGGKPLESFRIDLAEHEAFKNVRTNIIEKLLITFPKFAADLLHISEERSWYFIPTELRNLPAARIGVSFKTDQIALQKQKEIWVNDLLFSKMEIHEQETLILHELVMGVRLLQFSNQLDQCLVDIAILKLDPNSTGEYKEARRTCFKKYRSAAEVGESIGLGKSIRLEDYDYETIREITSTLIAKINSIDAQELEDYMAARKFKTYK